MVRPEFNSFNAREECDFGICCFNEKCHVTPLTHPGRKYYFVSALHEQDD